MSRNTSQSTQIIQLQSVIKIMKLLKDFKFQNKKDRGVSYLLFLKYRTQIILKFLETLTKYYWESLLAIQIVSICPENKQASNKIRFITPSLR